MSLLIVYVALVIMGNLIAYFVGLVRTSHANAALHTSYPRKLSFSDFCRFPKKALGSKREAQKWPSVRFTGPSGPTAAAAAR